MKPEDVVRQLEIDRARGSLTPAELGPCRDLAQAKAQWRFACENIAQATPREWGALDQKYYDAGLAMIEALSVDRRERVIAPQLENKDLGADAAEGDKACPLVPTDSASHDAAFEAGRRHEARENAIENAQIGKRHRKAVERAEVAEDENSRLWSVLNRVIAKADPCHCTHDDENCCAKVGEDCIV